MTTEPEAQGGWWSRKSTVVKVLIVVGGFIVALGIIAAFSGGSADDTAGADTTTTAGEVSSAGTDETSTTTDAEAATTTVSGLPGIGDPVRDGKFEFVVMEIEEPGNVYDPDNVLEDEAKGKWLVVHMSVENIGNEEQSFFAGDQRIILDERELAAEDFTFNGTSIENVNPGIVFDAVVMFDVPESFPGGGEGSILRLYDSAFSNGVEVGL